MLLGWRGKILNHLFLKLYKFQTQKEKLEPKLKNV